jgi:hypothetical protein
MSLYANLVWLHMLLLVLWLGGDLGVFILGQHFRKRSYSLPERLTILKLLVITDLGPRFAWALMVPMSLTLLHAGGWWPGLPFAAVLAGWVIGLGWSWLVFDSHAHDMTPRAARNRRIEGWLRYALAAFYIGLGSLALATGAPLAEHWLALKALLFGLIFVAAILIDHNFKPVGPQLMALINQGSSDATEVPLRATMDRTRRWVLTVYALLFLTSWLGSVKPF